MINNGHIGLHCLRNLKRKANEATNNFSGTAAGIGGSVCVNRLRPVEAVGGGMTKDEALDMALEFVEANHSGGPDAFELITAIKQARALDKKAENARELGLDYEPVFCEYCGGNDDADFGLPTDHCTDCARPQPAAQPAPVPLTDEQKRDLIKKSALWDMHIHIGWYSAPAKSFVEKTIQLIADIEAAHGITKGQP